MDILALLGKLAEAGMIPQQSQIATTSDQAQVDQLADEQQLPPIKEECVEEEDDDCGLSEVPSIRLRIGDLKQWVFYNCLYGEHEWSSCI